MKCYFRVPGPNHRHRGGTDTPVTGEILADPLLIVPQQPVEGQHVAIADEGQAVIDRVTRGGVGSNVQEKPAAEERAQCSGYRPETAQ